MTNSKRSSPARAPVTKAAAPAPAATAKAASKPPVKAPTPAPEKLPEGGKSKPKLVRDSFTIPKAEYQVLDALKLRAATLGRPSKKSEVLRAGIGALNAMSDKALVAALNLVPSLKTGRPARVAPVKPAKRPATGK